MLLHRTRRNVNPDAFDPESALAIELRRILIRLSRKIDLERRRSLMITSAELGEGKSLFALHFAIVMARHLRKRVLLIDADTRRPVQHQMLQVPRSPGLAEMLAAANGEAARKGAPLRTRMETLEILPAGAAGESPSRLFGGGRFRDVMAGLMPLYDLAIVDAPPVVPVSDPLHLLEGVDGVLFLLMAGRTHRDVARHGIDILKGAGANIVGVVANNLVEVLPRYYGRKYYGYEQSRR